MFKILVFIWKYVLRPITFTILFSLNYVLTMIMLFEIDKTNFKNEYKKEYGGFMIWADILAFLIIVVGFVLLTLKLLKII